jgi:hypothetical protein
MAAPIRAPPAWAGAGSSPAARPLQRHLLVGTACPGDAVAAVPAPAWLPGDPQRAAPAAWVRLRRLAARPARTPGVGRVGTCPLGLARRPGHGPQRTVRRCRLAMAHDAGGRAPAAQPRPGARPRRGSGPCVARARHPGGGSATRRGPARRLGHGPPRAAGTGVGARFLAAVRRGPAQRLGRGRLRRGLIRSRAAPTHGSVLGATAREVDEP